MPVELTLWLSYDTRSRRLTFNFWEGWGKEHFRWIENSEILLQPNQIDHSKERANVVLDFLNKNLPIEGKIKSFRAVPIYTKGNFYGLFCMGSLQEDSFNIDNEYLASIVTSQTTSLYERQQAMLNASQLLTMGNMISEISHDLRKPLTNVKGGLQVLRDRWPEINEKDDFFVMAEQEISRLSELVRELVDFSNPKKYQTERKRVEDAIDRAIKLVHVDLERKSIELQTDIEENLPLVPINSNQIIEVFLNMFMNAIDAMEEKGKLKVSARRYDNPKTEKKEVRIEISDTGKGIAPEDLEKVFDRYFTTKETGTGLGLAIVERIIKAHNGNIEVKSKLNEGSNFIISLPLS
jgi:signal transduction histidine kinase